MNLTGKDLLRGRILGRYLTLNHYAQHLGWSRQKLSDTLRGERLPTLDEVSDMSKTLEMSLEDLFDIFLAKPSTNIDDRS